MDKRVGYYEVRGTALDAVVIDEGNNREAFRGTFAECEAWALDSFTRNAPVFPVDPEATFHATALEKIGVEGMEAFAREECAK